MDAVVIDGFHVALSCLAGEFFSSLEPLLVGLEGGEEEVVFFFIEMFTVFLDIDLDAVLVLHVVFP